MRALTLMKSDLNFLTYLKSQANPNGTVPAPFKYANFSSEIGGAETKIIAKSFLFLLLFIDVY